MATRGYISLTLREYAYSMKKTAPFYYFMAQFCFSLQLSRYF
jgi:hypothetical protein